MHAYVHTKCRNTTGSFDSFSTVRVRAKRAPMPHHVAGLSFTASGYGARIPTEYMILWNDRWRRVYTRIYSNSGTLFIGKKPDECFSIGDISED